MLTSDIHMLPSNSPVFPIDPTTLLLRPEEKLISANRVEMTFAHAPLSALEALQLLAGVTKPEDIGTKGPVIAARVFMENQNINALRLYEVLFGRDSLIVANFVFSQYPELTRTTVKRLAELQGVSTVSASEEEPGKISHEIREPNDPLAQELTARRGWQWPYYGTIDATPLFIRAIVRYALEKDITLLSELYTDRGGVEKTIFNALQAAATWLLLKMDQNPEGLVESLRLNKTGGNINQCWKDSYDAYHHADGSLANIERGVASIEVQAIVYDALLDIVELYKALLSSPEFSSEEVQLLRDDITELEKRAAKLSRIIQEYFWIEDEKGGYFALGSDRDDTGKLRILKVRSSNMGHLLHCRLLDGDDFQVKEYKEKLVQTLFAPDMINVSGIRTLSSSENRFRPNSYHNGSVWLWDTFQISLGLLRQGYNKEAEMLWEKIMNVIDITKRFPEFVSGSDNPTPQIPNQAVKVFDTKYNFEHFIEQPPQEIQAWTVASVVAIENLYKKKAVPSSPV